MKWIFILLLIPVLAFGQNDAYPKSDRSLVAWYKLDGNALDQISGSSGTLVNSPTSVTDAKDGTAYQGAYYTSSKRIDTVSATLLNGASEFSFCLWTKLIGTNPDSNAGIFFTRWSGASRIGSGLTGIGQLFRINLNSAGGGGYEQTVGTAVLNQWHFIAFVRTVENRGKIYFDNRLVVDQPCTNILSQDTVFRIMQDDYSSAWYYNGSVDQVQVWNREISQNEVEQLFFGRWRKTLGQIAGINQGQGLGIGD